MKGKEKYNVVDFAKFFLVTKRGIMHRSLIQYSKVLTFRGLLLTEAV